MPHHDVAALAVPAHHAGQHRRRGRGARREHAGIGRVVQRGADVVAHPAVHAHVRPDAVHVLDRADLVEGHGGRPDDAAARLDRQPGHRDAEDQALGRHDRAQPGGQGLHLGGVVLGHVGDAEPAAQVELGHVHAVLGVDPPGQLEHPVRGHLEAAGVEDLRADVRVQPGELKLREREHAADRLVGGAGSEREAELLVVVRGRHELMRVRLDPGRHPHKDARPRPVPPPRSRPAGRSPRRSRPRCAPRRRPPPARSRRAACCCRAG